MVIYLFTLFKLSKKYPEEWKFQFWSKCWEFVIVECTFEIIFTLNWKLNCPFLAKYYVGFASEWSTKDLQKKNINCWPANKVLYKRKENQEEFQLQNNSCRKNEKNVWKFIHHIACVSSEFQIKSIIVYFERVLYLGAYNFTKYNCSVPNFW